jgi:hypothetical protein
MKIVRPRVGLTYKTDSVSGPIYTNGVAGKEAFYKEIIDQVHRDNYWPQVLESNW